MRRLYAFLILTTVFSINWAAHADMKIIASGYSKEVIDPQDQNSKTYYASMAGTCTGADGTSTCNSCDGTGLKPCSFTSAYPSMRFTIRATYTGSLASLNSIDITLGSTDNSVRGDFNLTLEGSNTIVASTTWGALCGRQSTGASATCANGLAEQDLTISIEGASGTTGQSGKVRIGASFVDTSQSGGEGWFYQECPANESQSGQGFCYAQTKPGDGKVYFENLVYSLNYPGSGSAEYKKVVLFYEVAKDGESDATTFGRITNGSPSASIDVVQEGSYSLTQNNVSGFSNGQRVCFRMANEDATGVIKYFTPTSANPEDWCSTPTQVVGLLDGKNCFIATAAYGSSMAPEVEWIRKFRNEFLLTNEAGRKFVRFYYDHSPPLANWIAGHEWARLTVRTLLWPVLAFSWISVNYGMMWALIFAVGATSFVIECLVLARRRLKLRSQT